MTEKQKKELERQANDYSFEFFYNQAHNYSIDVPHANFKGLHCALNTLGYNLEPDVYDEMMGTKYLKYKVVESN